jgi:hypothetical protein
LTDFRRFLVVGALLLLAALFRAEDGYRFERP